MPTTPAVTVVVPARNAQRDMRRCLDSLLAQTLRAVQPIEILVADDGSTDRTHAIALEYAERAPGAVRVHRQAGAGPAAARSRGVLLAEGKYIGFADSDGRAEPDMYERLFAAAEEGGAQIAGCGLAFAEARVFAQREARQELLPRFMSGEQELGLLFNKIFRRDFLRELPHRMDDEEAFFVMRCLAGGNAFAAVPGLLYHCKAKPSVGFSMDGLLSQYAVYMQFRREIGIDTEENRADYAAHWLAVFRKACLRELRLTKGGRAFYARMIDAAECPEVRDAMAVTAVAAADREALGTSRRRGDFCGLFAARDWAALEKLLRRERRTRNYEAIEH